MGAIFRGRKCYTGKVRETSTVRFPDYSNKTLLLGTSNASTINAFSYTATEDCWIYVKGYPAQGTDFKVHLNDISGTQLFYVGASTASSIFPLKKGQKIITAVGGGQSISYAEVDKFPCLVN